MSAPLPSTCPYCNNSARVFAPRGLKIHIARMHKDVLRSTSSQPGAVTSASPQLSHPQLCRLEGLATFKKTVPVLRHIPKGARNLAAGKLCELINRCVETNGTEEWTSLLYFSYSALKIPDQSGPGTLTAKVKKNIDSSCRYFSDNADDGAAARSWSYSLLRTIESKVHEGDLRGAVRLLISTDTIAHSGPETLASLQSKHPAPSRSLSFPPAPDRSVPPLTVKAEDVAQALSSFYSGSSAGLDGIRPAHLKELTTTTAGDNGYRLLECLTKMCNFLLSGQLNPEVCPYLYGASLCALAKKDGGVRPIAVGSVLRRLTAKLGCRAVKEGMAAYLQPHQLGFGTRLGCEAAIHAARTYATDPENACSVVVKLDIKNAFNSLERDVLLSEVKDKIPSLYPFLHQVYHLPSNLFFDKNLILSQVGAQQGDQLGPLTFSLAIHRAISDLKSPLNIWYLDDGTIGGKPDVVEQDLLTLVPRLRELGLEVNMAKCEFFPCSLQSRWCFSHFSTIIPGLKELDSYSFVLLGSPIFPVAVPEALEARKQLLLTAHERLKNLSAHIALTLLRMCFAVPKITYLLRTAPTWLYPDAVSSFDGALKHTVETLLNVSLSEVQWSQATLPIRHGGLGVRRVRDVSLPAFLASAHGVADLVTTILSLDGDRASIPFAADAFTAWSALNPGESMPDVPQAQRSWDDVKSKAVLDQLISNSSGVDLARLKAVSQPESGAWLHALPSPHLGTLLDSDSLRVAVALRLGCNVCEPHRCICGTTVEANGHHGLSCRRCSGRFPRHHALNDIIRRALVSANVPCVLEPRGLSRTDGKKPDGLTLVPWRRGKCLLWDATCVSTFATSYLSRTVQVAGAAAELAAVKKRSKYVPLESLMAIIKFGYALVVVSLLLMIWASLSKALELHVDTGHPPCLFQALCTCSKPAGDLGIVTCIHVPLLRVPAAVNSSKIFTLQLTGNQIRDLEPQFFQATSMYRLAINQNPLEIIHEEAFYGLDNTLWELELREDKLTAVPSRSLRYLQKLRSLDLSGNEIADISGDNWRGLENTLHTLILADNSIAKLPLDAFNGLPMLETLDLHGNHLALIDPGVFRDGMGRLNKLLLGDNQLTYIPYEEISPLRQLRILDLSNNVIKQVPPAHELNAVKLSLDSLKLDNNVIRMLFPGSFKYFNILNYTSLDGNPIYALREDAFRNAKIKTLSLRDCGLTELSPASFAGLENSLQSLDLSENNLTTISKFMLNKLDMLRVLNLRENRVDINLLASSNPSEYAITSFNNFQYRLFYLDISGASSMEMSMQELRRMRALRYLAIGKLLRRSINSDDFVEFGTELENLKIFGSYITRIESSAFQHVRTIKTLDLSENEIEFIDPFAFAELHSLTTLKMANGLTYTVKILPFEPLKALIELQHLDLSNNKLKNVPDTSFHFLYKLKTLNLQDNEIDHFSKGTLQGDIHSQLESVTLSLNQLRQIEQHTFVELKELQEVLIEDNLIELIQRRAFTTLDNLKVIKLKGNRINEITEEAFQNLPALKELDISFNRLEIFRFSIFDQVGSATALKVNVSYNWLTGLTDSSATQNFFSPNFYLPAKANHGTVSVNIRVLDFSHNNISYIAPYFFRHSDLTLSVLYLSHNKIKNITREVFGSMNMLQYLDLSHNQIFQMEYDCFKKVRNLQFIDLSHNYLREMPIELFREMQFLTSVDLSNNRINNLADHFIPSPALERLDLSNNDLSRVPTNCLTTASAGNLVELDLSSNTIPAVSTSDFLQRFRNPEQGEEWQEEHDDYNNNEYLFHTVGRDPSERTSKVFHQKKQTTQYILYKSLAVLDLSDNHLVRIDLGTFSTLPRLRWLDISDNSPFTSGERTPDVFKGLERRLSHLGLKNVSLLHVPPMFLPKLKSLDLSYNNLPSIPTETTANLTRLRALDLSYNDLTAMPVAVHSLNDLRWLSLSGNPITALMNSSLYGISNRLEYLDVTRLRCRIFEHGVFSKMFALRTLKITHYANVREFNVPKMLTHNAALKNLLVEVDIVNSGVEFGKEMGGASLPCKLNNITIAGKALKYLAPYLLIGVHSKDLRLTVYNTSIEEIAPEVFWRPGRIRNLTMDLRNNYITSVPNPGQSEWPGVPNSVFLRDILVEGNPLYCDCGIGWIESWDRKRRQYLCKSPFKCVTTRDDIRFARCPGYYNRTLSDVISRDLDCSWSRGFFKSPNLYIVIGMSILTYLYI